MTSLRIPAHLDVADMPEPEEFLKAQAPNATACKDFCAECAVDGCCEDCCRCATKSEGSA